MDKALEQKISELFKSEEFKARFNNIDEYDEFKQLLAEKGIIVSDEEMKDILKSAVAVSDNNQSGELSEEQMENVSGGLIGWILLGTGLAVAGGYCANKLRRMYNSAMGRCNG